MRGMPDWLGKLRKTRLISEIEADIFHLSIYLHAVIREGYSFLLMRKIRHLLNAVIEVLARTDVEFLRKSHYQANMAVIKLRQIENLAEEELPKALEAQHHLTSKVRVYGAMYVANVLWYHLKWQRQWRFPQRFNYRSAICVSMREAFEKLKQLRFLTDNSGSAIYCGLEYSIAQYTMYGPVVLGGASSIENDPHLNSYAIAWAYSLMPGYESKALEYHQRAADGRSEFCLWVPG
jgi:hypothetical protein